MTQHRLTAYERVMRRTVRTESGCLEFQGSRFHDGYARVTVDGKSVTASRVIWAETDGPIPAGLYVCHKCDNPPCVERSHLFLGTPADNGRDAYQKGRLQLPFPRGKPGRGLKNHRGKLSDADVEAIRARRATGERLRIIACDFSVSTTHVSDIARGKRRAAQC